MPKMTRKDFETIAETLRQARPTDQRSTDYLVQLNAWVDTVEWFVHSLRRTNPQFNSDRFRTACGV